MIYDGIILNITEIGETKNVVIEYFMEGQKFRKSIFGKKSKMNDNVKLLKEKVDIFNEQIDSEKTLKKGEKKEKEETING